MPTEILYIKNMVCDRCKKTVTKILCDLEIEHKPVLLGEVHFDKQIDKSLKEKLNDRLLAEGFEIIDNRKSRIIEQIKKSLIELIQNEYPDKRINLSKYLAQQLNHDYSYLSNLFSSVEGKTIEHYFIQQKIEKVKELLVYDELTLSEIAYRLGYSSVAHLSNQFKKETGLTPSHFKTIGSSKRQSLDSL
jgi:AraC family transcriptional regulator